VGTLLNLMWALIQNALLPGFRLGWLATVMAGGRLWKP